MSTHYASTNCQHVFPDQHTCGSPALRGQPFCYYHHPARAVRKDAKAKAVARAVYRGGFTQSFEEIHQALQLATHAVLAGVSTHRLDARRAGTLLYSLNLALEALPTDVPCSSYSEPASSLFPSASATAPSQPSHSSA